MKLEDGLSEARRMPQGQMARLSSSSRRLLLAAAACSCIRACALRLVPVTVTVAIKVTK